MPNKEIALTPAMFYGLVDLINTLDEGHEKAVEIVSQSVGTSLKAVDAQCKELKKAVDAFREETRRTVRQRVEPFEDLLSHTDKTGSSATLTEKTFLEIVYRIAEDTREGFEVINELLQQLRPGKLMLSDNKFDVKNMNADSIAVVNYEIQLNSHVIACTVDALATVRQYKRVIYRNLRQIIAGLDAYQQMLVKRHSVEGVEVIDDAVVTDVAMTVFENVDSHGEIEDGTEANEVSAFSVRKAELMTQAIKVGLPAQFIADPTKFTEFIENQFLALWTLAELLESDFLDVAKKCKDLVDPYSYEEPNPTLRDFESELSELNIVNPQQVKYRDKGRLLTATERHVRNHNNATLRKLVRMLRDTDAEPKVIVVYILKRKEELHKFFNEENSFYTCRIGAGNQFRGIAPGALEIVPDVRPNVAMEEIIGSGFDEVGEFFEAVEEGARWFDLNTATSPSRSAGKSNVLLIGPQGCGKSEVLRAVGGDKRSIGVFAVGSDFNTCWLGEATKNPKRLFEHAVKLHKDSKGKHVHLLLDEVDSVMNNEGNNPGYINLTIEFQILMDGIKDYPNISVWGATNNPQRIPMPMIRRFSKALIVGQLDQEQRIRLLKFFGGFMPLDDIEDTVWDEFATRLDGATGDVIRKVIDPIWRTKMAAFTSDNPKEAKRIQDWLNRDEKFEIGNFTSEKRAEMVERLRPFVTITADDLDRQIAINLDNVAIHHEIETARRTYADAEAFLHGIRDSRG